MAMCTLSGEERTGGHLFGVIARSPAPRGCWAPAAAGRISTILSHPPREPGYCFHPYGLPSIVSTDQAEEAIHFLSDPGPLETDLCLLVSEQQQAPQPGETCFLAGLPHSFWVECLGSKFPRGWNSTPYKTSDKPDQGEQLIPPLSLESHSQGMFLHGSSPRSFLVRPCCADEQLDSGTAGVCYTEHACEVGENTEYCVPVKSTAWCLLAGVVDSFTQSLRQE